MTKGEYITKEFVLTPYKVEKLCFNFMKAWKKYDGEHPCEGMSDERKKFMMSWVAGYLETIELRED